MPKELIVNADDFGLSEEVSLGIIRGFKEGIVTSCNVMMNLVVPTEIQMLRENPNLGVAVHINLTKGRPVSEKPLGNLVDENGAFILPKNRPFDEVDEEFLVTEIDAQIDALLAEKLPTLDHLDSHHHTHKDRRIFTAVKNAAAKHGLAIRATDPWMVDELRDAHVFCNDHFIEGFMGREQITPENLISIIGRLEEGVSEIMCHPGLPGVRTRVPTGYLEERAIELAALTDERVRAFMDKSDVILRRFA